MQTLQHTTHFNHRNPWSIKPVSFWGPSAEQADNNAAASRRKSWLTWSLFLSRWRTCQPHTAAARPPALKQTLALPLPPSWWKPGGFAAQPGLHGWRWAGQSPGKRPRRWAPGEQCGSAPRTPARPRPQLHGEVRRLWSGADSRSLSVGGLTFPRWDVSIVQAEAIAKLLLQDGDYLLSVGFTESRVGLVAHQKGIVNLSI